MKGQINTPSKGLPCKRNGQEVIMETKHIAFCMHYIFTSQMAKRKNLSVSLIPACILILYSVSSISGCRNYFSAVYFSYVFVVMINFWQYVEYEDRYSKTPTSVNRKDVSEHIYQVIHISLWFYGSGFGCQN